MGLRRIAAIGYALVAAGLVVSGIVLVVVACKAGVDGNAELSIVLWVLVVVIAAVAVAIALALLRVTRGLGSED